jgi:catechol 2,3-dioxygenase
MQIKELGHVVLYVRNLETMIKFYHGILGFGLIARMSGAAVFSGGRTHHEMLLIEIGEGYQKDTRLQPGLYHIGFKIGDKIEELKEAMKLLKKEKVQIVGTADHHVSKSIYILDPDGNELELYIDTDIDWKRSPEIILQRPKVLEI